MDIVIGSEASIATPPTGYATLFVNTDKNNILYLKYPDGSFVPYNGSSDDCSCDMAKAWVDRVTCALKEGIINASQFEDIINQGLTVSTSTVTDSDGNVTNTVNVGARDFALVSISLNASTVTHAHDTPYQIVTTFNPTNTSNQGLTFISSDATKATVSATGLVTFVGPTGIVVITIIPASDPSKSKTVTITIT